MSNVIFSPITLTPTLSGNFAHSSIFSSKESMSMRRSIGLLPTKIFQTI
jgi:hypothetical protein